MSPGVPLQAAEPLGCGTSQGGQRVKVLGLGPLLVLQVKEGSLTAFRML